MSRLQLIGGSYSARSVIANVQRCVNYYPEMNRKDSPVPFTYYQRPGRRFLVQGEPSPVRGLYRPSNGIGGYCVIGQSVYFIETNWTLTLLGTLATPANNPVSFTDNGTTIMLVDGSPSGYSIDMATHAFAIITDPTGAFYGATTCTVIDTFIIWNYPGTPFFGSTLSNGLVFNALYIAGKVAYPDPLVTLVVNRHQIILLGQLKSEIWYDAGNPQFPFLQLPGAYIEHGCVAPYSLASQDIEIYWLGQDLEGQGVVFSLKGYDTRRISNHALEFAIQQMSQGGGTISDAIGYTYQQGGHVFYVLNFPTGNQTWVYDASLGDDPTLAWHQIAWTDANGNLNRDRGNCGAFINGENVIGDFSNGALYALDPTLYVDQVPGQQSPISYVKGFPHIVEVWNEQIGQQASTDGKRVMFSAVRLDFEVGNGALEADGTPAKVWLRWSDDKGKTWGNAVMQSAGAPGEYLTEPKWAGAGVARDRVFEIAHSIVGPAALNGGWVDGKVLNT